MRIAVLGSPDSWYVNDLRRAAGDKHQIFPVDFRAITSAVGHGRTIVQTSQLQLDATDALLVRVMPAGTLEQVVFRMDALAQLEAAGLLVLNPPRAIEVAVDKYLALARLQAAGLKVPETVVCQTVDDAMDAFQRLDSDVVIKPLFGAEGRGITRLTDVEVAWRAFKALQQLGAVIHLQRFIEHEGFDLRLLVIGEDVLGVRRVNDRDWRTNVSRGAQAIPLTMNDQLTELARAAAAAVGAPLAGVDILPSRQGESYILEVNAVPGWRALARTLQIDVAARVLRCIEGGVGSRR